MNNAIRLGQKSPTSAGIGFTSTMKSVNNAVEEIYANSGHLITIAPTGTGKGVNCIIPTLLTYTGNVVVVDPKGENYEVTHQQRKALGQEVVVLDPFDLTSCSFTHDFNLLDLLNIDDKNFIDDAKSLAELLMLGTLSYKEPYWDMAARQLLTTLIIIVKCTKPKRIQHLATLAQMLNESSNKLAQTISTFKREETYPASQFIQTFEYPARTADCILGTLKTHIEFLFSQNVMDQCVETTFDMALLDKESAISIFLVIPPEKMNSHQGLLRCWLGTMLQRHIDRRKAKQLPSLFIVDEAAQLGVLPQLQLAITLLRGYGITTWSFWQDIQQLEHLYPNQWQTMINNCQTIQCFGIPNLMSAIQLSEVLGGVSAESLLNLSSVEQVIQQRGQLAIICSALNYLEQEQYQGLYRPNPLFEIMPESKNELIRGE